MKPVPPSISNFIAVRFPYVAAGDCADALNVSPAPIAPPRKRRLFIIVVPLARIVDRLHQLHELWP
jgi:hypothetical protein